MISILYVDDEPDLLEMGKIFLEESGDLKVDTVPSAREAVELLRTRLYDAVVSDFQMPDMDGIEFLKYIRQKAGNLPVILFTGKGREEVVIAALNNGADYYLQKGGEPEHLFAELKDKIHLAVDRQKAKDRILFFNRLYAVMSGINTEILHIRSQEDLFQEICRISVEKGSFSRAWIGLLNTEKTAVVPIANKGFAEGNLTAVPVSAEAGPDAEGLSGIAAFWEKMAIRNTIGLNVTSSESEPAREDYHATAAFPIWLHGSVIGTFQIYAREPTFFGEDETRLIEGVVSDISFALENLDAEEQRIAAEHALQESEEKFRILVEESLVGVYIIQKNRFLHVNPKFAEIVGYPHAEIIDNLSVNDLVVPDDQNLVSSNLQHRLLGEIKSLHYSFEGRRKDGTIINLEVAGTRAFLQGQPVIIGTMIDISDRIRSEKERAEKLEELSAAYKKIRTAEERLWAHIAALTESQDRLNENERRMTDIINFLPDATFAIDTESRVIVWNRAIEKMTGISAEDMVGKGNFDYALPFYEKHRPVLADLVLRYDDEIARTYDYLHKEGETFTAKAFLRRLRGGKGGVALLVAAPLFDTKGNIAGAIETIRDISEYEDKDLALQESKERYCHIIEYPHEGVIIVKDGCIVFSNPVFRKILGDYSSDELQGKAVSDFILTDEALTRSLQTGKITKDTACCFNVRVTGNMKDGSEHPLECRTMDIDWEGKPAIMMFLSEVH
jgi:PAS domain S-box-containing protein